jgi:hypothetical protein
MQKNCSNGNGQLSFEISITPQVKKDGEWCVAFCPEVPEANGQGRTPEESVQDLKLGVISVMQDRRADAASHKTTGRLVSAMA